MRALGAMLMIAAWMMPGSGCGPRAQGDSGLADGSGADQPGAERGSARERADWPFWPVKMRIHPASRIVPDAASGQIMIEARVEFRDQFDDVTKAFGQVRLDLHRTRPAPGAEAAGTWNMDMRDLSVNRDRYDEVTRTYLFRLALEGVTLPSSPVLKIYFLGADGATLSDDADLQRQR